MPRVGFEHTTPVFERAKIVYALDSVSIASGIMLGAIVSTRVQNFSQALTLHCHNGGLVSIK
jgi:hypothetical protein